LIPVAVLAQDRKYNLTVTQTNEAVITGEKNYQESFGVNKYGKDVCIVEEDVQIDRQWHRIRGEYSGSIKEEACKTASMVARKELTTSIKPSIISSKAEIIYEETGNTKHIDGYRKGDLVDVASLHERPDHNKDFSYQGTRCKWLYDIKRGEKGIKQYNLIACKLSGGWVVEDIF
jgi:hypothetical protein